MTGTELNLELQAGDDALIRFTFQSDVTAWTGWVARVRSRKNETWDFDLDISGDPVVIVATLDEVQTSEMFDARGLKWQLRGFDGDGHPHTLFKGDVSV